MLATSNFIFGQLQGKRILDLPEKFLNPEDHETDDLNKIINGRPWKVYSDRTGNTPSINASRSSAKLDNPIEFMDEFYVLEKVDNYLHIVKDNNLSVGNTLSISAKDYGWLPMEKLLLSKHCMVTPSGKIDKKAMLLNTVDAIKQGQIKKQDVVPFYSDPELKHPMDEESTLFEIFFVYKITDEALLIGRSNRILPGMKPSRVIIGWVPRNRIVMWNYRIAIEPNWDQKAVIERMKKGIIPSVYLTENAAVQQAGGQSVQQKHLLWESNEEELLRKGRYIGEWRRFPVYSSLNEDVLKVGAMGKVVTKDLIIDGLDMAKIDSISSRLRNKKRNINLVFVLDGTTSMQPYFSAVSNAVRNSMLNLQDNATGNLNTLNNIRFGAVVYRDYAEGSRLSEVIPLTSRYQDVSDKLSKVQAFDRFDKDQPEAVFYGIKKAIRLFKPNETNILILIGDAGNHARQDNSQVNKEQLTDLLYQYEVHFLAYQVHNGYNSTSFDQFVPQIQGIVTEYSNKLYDKYSKIDFKKLAQTRPELVTNGLNHLKLKDAAITASIIYPDKGADISPSRLEQELPVFVKNIDENTNDFIERIDQMRRGGGTSKSGPQGTVSNQIGKSSNFAPSILLYLSNLGISQDKIKAMGDKKFQMFKVGYASNNVDGFDYPLFRKSLLLSRLELGEVINNIQRLVNSPGANRRERMQETWYELLKKQIGDVNEEDLMNKTMEEVTKMLFEVPTSSEFLKNVRLRDITDKSVLSNNDFETYVYRLEKKLNRLTKEIYNNDGYPQKFYTNDEVYYWVPSTNMP